jgi:hypothetical protein
MIPFLRVPYTIPGASALRIDAAKTQPLFSVLAPLPLSISGVPDAARIGVPYTFTPTITGGQGLLVFTLSGTLPAGLSFDAATGEITGTPTGGETQAALTIMVSDATGDTELWSFVLTVVALGNASLFADSTAAPGGNGSASSKFNTIAALTAVLVGGETIQINGTFAENLKITVPNVTVLGNFTCNGLVSIRKTAADWLEYAADGTTLSPGSTLWGVTAANTTRTGLLVVDRRADTRIHGGELGFNGWRKDTLAACKRQGEWYLPPAGTNRVFIKSATNPATYYASLEMSTEGVDAMATTSALNLDLSAATYVLKGFNQGPQHHVTVKGGIAHIQFMGGRGIGLFGAGDATYQSLTVYDVGGSGQLDPIDVSSFGLHLAGGAANSNARATLTAKRVIINNSKEDNLHYAADNNNGLSNESYLLVDESRPGASRIGQVGHHENNIDNNSTRSGRVILRNVHIHNDVDPLNTAIFQATASGLILDVKIFTSGPAIEAGMVFGAPGLGTYYTIGTLGANGTTGTGGVGTYPFTSVALTQATPIQMFASFCSQHASAHCYGTELRMVDCVLNSRVPFSEGYAIRGRRGGELLSLYNTQSLSWGADGPADIDGCDVLSVGSSFRSPGGQKPALRMTGGDLKVYSSSFWGAATGISLAPLGKFGTGLAGLTFGPRSALGAVKPGKYTYRVGYSGSSDWLGNYCGYFTTMIGESAVLNGLDIRFYNWTPLNTTSGYADFDVDEAVNPPVTIDKTGAKFTLVPTMSKLLDSYFAGTGPTLNIVRGASIPGNAEDYAGNTPWDFSGSDQAVRLAFNLQAGTENITAVNYANTAVTATAAVAGNLSFDTKGKLGGSTWTGAAANAAGPVITFPIGSVSVAGGLATLEITGHPLGVGNKIFIDGFTTPHQLNGWHHVWTVPDANHVTIIAERAVPDGVAVVSSSLTMTLGQPTAVSPAIGAFSKPDTSAYRSTDANGKPLIQTGNRGAYA